VSGNGDEHLRLCRQDVDNQLGEVVEQAKRAQRALATEREAAAELIADRRQLRDGVGRLAKRVGYLERVLRANAIPFDEQDPEGRW
jgi:hypothetical protein